MLGGDRGENHLADAVFFLFDYGEKEAIAAKGDKHEKDDADKERNDGFAQSIRVTAILSQFVVDNFVTVSESDNIERIDTSSGILSHDSP